MNKVGKIITCAVTAVAIVGVSLGVHFGYSDKSFKQEEHTVDTSSHPLRVAIISDLQLPNSTDKNTHQYKSFESTLTMLKNKGMDALIIDGDFTDQGTKNAWNTYKEIYDKVMAGKKSLSNFLFWATTILGSLILRTVLKFRHLPLSKRDLQNIPASR